MQSLDIRIAEERAAIYHDIKESEHKLDQASHALPREHQECSLLERGLRCFCIF